MGHEKGPDETAKKNSDETLRNDELDEIVDLYLRKKITFDIYINKVSRHYMQPNKYKGKLWDRYRTIGNELIRVKLQDIKKAYSKDEINKEAAYARLRKAVRHTLIDKYEREIDAAMNFKKGLISKKQAERVMKSIWPVAFTEERKVAKEDLIE